MRKEISKEVYDELQGVTGISLQQEVKYFLVTGDVRVVKRIGGRRSPLTLLRVMPGYTGSYLTPSQQKAYQAICEAFGDAPVTSRDMAAKVAEATSCSMGSGSYMVSKLHFLGMLKEVEATPSA